MNKEQIEQRIATIQNEMNTMRLMHAKLEGHLNEAQIMLESFGTKQAEPTEPDLHVGEYNGETNNQTEECATSE